MKILLNWSQTILVCFHIKNSLQDCFPLYTQLCSYVVYFTMLSHTVLCQIVGWVGWIWSWPNLVALLEFAWRVWRKPWKWPRFKPSTSQSQVQSVTWICSVPLSIWSVHSYFLNYIHKMITFFRFILSPVWYLPTNMLKELILCIQEKLNIQTSRIQ